MIDLEWNRKSIFEKLDWLKQVIEELVEKVNHNISAQQEQLRTIAARLSALEKPSEKATAKPKRARRTPPRRTNVHHHRKGDADMPRKPSFGNHIRNARHKRKLTVAEIATQMGVSDAAVYMWETDRSRPSDANLSALCKVLKLPVRATRAMAAG